MSEVQKAIAAALKKFAVEGLEKHLQKNGDVFQGGYEEFRLFARGFVPYKKAPSDKQCDISMLDFDHPGFETREEAVAFGEQKLDDWYRGYGYTVGVSPPLAGVSTCLCPPANSPMGRRISEAVADALSRYEQEWENSHA
jgi:hypothetical protein